MASALGIGEASLPTFHSVITHYKTENWHKIKEVYPAPLQLPLKRVTISRFIELP